MEREKREACEEESCASVQLSSCAWTTFLGTLLLVLCGGTSIQDPAVVQSCDGQVRVGQVSPLLLTIVHAKLLQVKYSKAVVCPTSWVQHTASRFLSISHDNFRQFFVLHCIDILLTANVFNELLKK